MTGPRTESKTRVFRMVGRNVYCLREYRGFSRVQLVKKQATVNLALSRRGKRTVTEVYLLFPQIN
jgi:hypothetical protein